MTGRRSPGAWLLLAAWIASPAVAAPLPAIAIADGYYDDVTVDPAAGRLFVGRGDGLTVLDLATGAVTQWKLHGRYVHAIAVLPHGEIAVTDGGNGRILVLDASTGAQRGTVAVDGHPDSITYDAADHAVFATNAAGTNASLVGLAPLRRLATISLGGRPETAVADGAGRVFVNLSDRNDIAVVSVASRRVIARYRLEGCEAPSGLAFDPLAGVLIAACDNRRAVVLRARDGRALASLPIGAGADAVVADPSHHRAFIPCGGSGTLFVLAITSAGASIAAVRPTAVGARTAGYDPATNHLFLPTATPGRDRMIQFGASVAKPLPGTARLLSLSP